jgi:hypothetical protein
VRAATLKRVEVAIVGQSEIALRVALQYDYVASA